MTIKYQELDSILFTDSPKESTSIEELKEILFPMAEFEEKFYETNSLRLLDP
ncbi:hypothetical protein ACIQ1D_17970 [Lysinibacillus xylanilyticus]|uniref:hypothetical protein n=1 Tax=Lysinibacillus xylanilyticus TaxID=582475 RepID=UPI0037FD8E15